MVEQEINNFGARFSGSRSRLNVRGNRADGRIRAGEKACETTRSIFRAVLLKYPLGRNGRLFQFFQKNARFCSGAGAKTIQLGTPPMQWAI